MPELPEVEITRAGIAPYVTGQTFSNVIVRQAKLRLPVPDNLAGVLHGQKLHTVRRRAKYLLLQTETDTVLLHLGLSGSLRVFPNGSAPPPQKHDHIDFLFADGTVLRYRDPRRFGLVTLCSGNPEKHPLLAHLGPEPLGDDFDAGNLKKAWRNQSRAVKTALMDQKSVVGVGNIYANEALFAAAIRPTRAAKRLTRSECERLVAAVKDVLQRAIAAGGSTLRDFLHSDGKPGYFQQQYSVYGREGEPCPTCGRPIQKAVIGGRSSFYCAHCQH